MRIESINLHLLLAILALLTISMPTFTYAAIDDATKIVGKVHDQQQAAINAANISVFNSSADGKEILVTSTSSDAQGAFSIDQLLPGKYEIVVQQDNYQIYRTIVEIKLNGNQTALDITLNPLKAADGLTVTAVVSSGQDIFEASQQMEYATKNELNTRPGVLLPELLQEEPGIRSVQGSAFYGQVIIRGLTGQRVASLIDDVRFNNGIFTTALESTLGLIDTNVIKQVEVIYGPGSALYGSDALGGTINVVSDKPIFYTNGWETHGTLSSFFGSGNASAGGSIKLTAGNSRLSLLFNGFGQRINDIRPGQGIDSHSYVTRLLGLPSKILGDRLQDTGFLHYGTTSKIVWKIANDQQLSVFYQHATERNTRVYFLLNGGSAGQESEFSPQVLDFFYTRYKKQQLGFLDSLSGTFSYNRQREQFNVQPSTIPFNIDEYKLLRSLGYALQGTSHIGSYNFLTFGGEIYDERTTNKRSLLFSNFNIPLPGTFPNKAKYTTYGTYIQNTAELIPGKVRLNGGVRYSAFFYKTDSTKNLNDIFGNPTVPNSSIRNDDVTFNLEGIVFIKQRLNLIANVTRGFRSPNIIDLGSVGNLPSGFEVLTSEATALGGFVGTANDPFAVSNGKKVAPLKPESLLNYEFGIKYQDRRFRSSFTFFTGTISDFITQRALILPQGAVGKIIGGVPIVAQNPLTGTVFVPLDGRPVIIKANATDVRLYGFELDSQINISNSLSISGNFSYLRGEDKKPSPLIPALPGDLVQRRANDIPDIEGGLPPATGFFSIRYQPAGKSYWIEAYSNMASYQDRLSTSDLTDIRIGASRSRNDIAFFFNGRGRELGFIGNGPDGQPFTADDQLLLTGETLPQVQNRVLGVGVDRAPLFNSTPGYATFNLRGGFEIGERSSVTVILENILDKNYRSHGSGIDSPGRNLVIRYSWRF